MSHDRDESAALHGPKTRACSTLWWTRLLAAVAVLPGCTSFRQTASEVAIREPGDRLLSAPQPVQPEARKDLEFAWLAEAAYGKTPHGERARALLAQARAKAPTGTESASPPCPDSEAALKNARWHPWPGFPDDGLRDRITHYHLRIEVWYRQDPPAVAVAFGGTVINNRNDWLSNLRWFLPAHKDEYSETVQEFAPAFAKEYTNRLHSGGAQWGFLRDAKLYAAGHSLGGGLAQQFAYALPTTFADLPPVYQVYAFDPSPVTGFYSVDLATREKNRKSLSIDRVYERGEILAIARSFTSLFVPPSASSPTIRGVRYALFYPNDPISGHSMPHLVCRMYDASR